MRTSILPVLSPRKSPANAAAVPVAAAAVEAGSVREGGHGTDPHNLLNLRPHDALGGNQLRRRRHLRPRSTKDGLARECGAIDANGGFGQVRTPTLWASLGGLATDGRRALLPFYGRQRTLRASRRGFLVTLCGSTGAAGAAPLIERLSIRSASARRRRRSRRSGGWAHALCRAEQRSRRRRFGRAARFRCSPRWVSSCRHRRRRAASGLGRH
jgi:hypothetical protein